MTKLMLVGATGLVGQSVLQLALTDARVTQLVAPTRRALTPHPRLLNPLVDFDHLPPDAPWWAVDAVVCALGTTIRVAGSQAAFYKVDHDYPLRVAELAQQAGAQAFALNSALGSTPPPACSIQGPKASWSAICRHCTTPRSRWFGRG